MIYNAEPNLFYLTKRLLQVLIGVRERVAERRPEEIRVSFQAPRCARVEPSLFTSPLLLLTKYYLCCQRAIAPAYSMEYL